MFLTYVQHVGCATRLLVIAPAGAHLKCPDCPAVFDPATWSDNPVPCPFIEQMNAKCAIVIKPTRGFFQSYKIGDDLHIGISDSQSVVHSYWTDGVMGQSSSWDKSIVVYQFPNDDTNWFDNALASFSNEQREKFLPQHYNEIEWNCFDWVMEFLRFHNFRCYTKLHFVSEFVQESLKVAMKYCSLFSKVQERGFIMIA